MGVGHMPNTSDIVTIEEFFEQAKGYLNDKQLEFVRSAYILAADAHKEQRRKSGEPYIIHPIGVASILASLQMDEYTLAAAFLHDVVEDTEYTFDDIRNIFGMVVANLVDGVTKLGKIAYISKEDRQIENYRKMFLAMARDIRVVLIKLADRLHNMRTMKFMPAHKQQSISRETLEIYAPLAHRLGIHTIKWELEDLAFRYMKAACTSMKTNDVRIHDMKKTLQAVENIKGCVDMLHVGNTPFYSEVVEKMIPYMNTDACMIVGGIYTSEEKKKWWKQLKDDERVRITFDLYDIGIVLFDPKRYKQNYIVNFF